MNEENTNKNPYFDIDDEEEDDDESLGHESLTDDKDVDIDVYEAVDRNPILDQDDDIDDQEDDDQFYDSNDNTDPKVIISRSKLLMIKSLLKNIEQSQKKLSDILLGEMEGEEVSPSEPATYGATQESEDESDENIIEGVFNGENMIGGNGKEYSIPSNYASKSKLVEGDILKLTITDKGTFIYKQIKPIERRRVIGRLEKTPDGSFIVTHGDKRWRVITASVTYFKGETGDEIVILVPREGTSKWGAVENIIKIHN